MIYNFAKTFLEPEIRLKELLKMAWDDWVFGILTGGLYNIGKGIYKASEAAEAAGDAAEDIAESAGTTLAILGETVARLGSELESFVQELEEMVTVERVTPRDEDDLWDEEVERLKALRKKEKELLKELEELGAADRDFSWNEVFWEALTGRLEDLMEEFRIRSKLALVRSAIREILYEEPGVIPTSIYHFKEILERFNTLEQPRIEEMMDSTQDNMEEVNEILKEVKKLFVVRTWKPVPSHELTEDKKKKIDVLEKNLKAYEGLIEKNSAISLQIRNALIQRSEKTSKALSLSMKRVRRMQPALDENTGRLNFSNPSESGNPNPGRNPEVKTWVAMKRRPGALAIQPAAMRIASLMERNETAGYAQNYNFVKGVMRYYEREKLKIEKEIFRLKWIPVEEPGLIPKTLDEVRMSLNHFRTEEQPRVDNVLDNLADAIAESRNVMMSVNNSLTTNQAILDSISKNSLYIKLGLGTLGALIIANLFVGLIVLVRMAFGL
jgi:hypothetical protein